jgi:DNA polymerase I-like protein with 3'-5' exonuclease and polymerase domains
MCEHNAKGFGRQLSHTFIELLSTCDVIVGHNLCFDLSYVFKSSEIQQFLLRGGTIWDTQVAEYILTAQQHQYSSLADLQEKYLGQKKKIERVSRLYAKGVGADKIVQARTRCPRLWKQYEEYCRLDGSTTLEIFKQQYISAKQQNMHQVVQLYQDYLLSLINMSTTGIQLDMKACEQTLTDFNLESISYLERAQDFIKPLWKNPRLPKFNINSPDHRSAILFGGEIKNVISTLVGKYKNGNDKYKSIEHKIWIDGFQVDKSCSTETKKKGIYSTDKKVVLPKLLSATKDERLKTYIGHQQKSAEYNDGVKVIEKGFLKFQVGGVLYPNFNNTAVITGRLSSSKPNLQNVTKKTDIGKALHSLFIAPEGWKCISIDFAQLEIWVSALLSGDENLIADLQSGIDMHCVRVSMMEDCTYEHAVQMCKVEKNKEWVNKRSAAKTFSYQRAYGAGVKKLVEFTGLSKETIERLIEKEELRYPKASNLWMVVKDSIEKTKTFSMRKNIHVTSDSESGEHRFYKNIELLPIFDNVGNVDYNRDVPELRKIGYWTSITGKKYHFPDIGQMTKFGLKRSVTPTIMKNYPMQGTAADIQGATTAELLRLLVKHSDKILMINEVHDSKSFYVRIESINKAVPLIVNIIEDVSNIFEKRFGVKVPFKFPIDVEIGDNFGDMEKLDLERDNEGKCIGISKG